MRLRTTIIAAVGAGVLAVAGGTTAVLAAQHHDTTAHGTGASPVTASGSTAGSADGVPLATAVRTAQHRLPDATPVEADLDHDGGPHWEIDMLSGGTGRTVYVDATTGDVQRVTSDHVDADDRAAARAKVDLLSAVRAARQEAPHAPAPSEADADLDGGTLVWEVTFGDDDEGNGTEQVVTVDSATGHAAPPTTDD